MKNLKNVVGCAFVVLLSLLSAITQSSFLSSTGQKIAGAAQSAKKWVQGNPYKTGVLALTALGVAKGAYDVKTKGARGTFDGYKEKAKGATASAKEVAGPALSSVKSGGGLLLGAAGASMNALERFYRAQDLMGRTTGELKKVTSDQIPLTKEEIEEQLAAVIRTLEYLNTDNAVLQMSAEYRSKKNERSQKGKK